MRLHLVALGIAGESTLSFVTFWSLLAFDCCEIPKRSGVGVGGWLKRVCHCRLGVQLLEVPLEAMIRVLLFLASCSAAVAFVPPAQQSSVKYQAPVARAQEKVDEASSPVSSVVFGASVGYAAAAVGAAARQGRVTRFAEGDAPAVART